MKFLKCLKKFSIKIVNIVTHLLRHQIISA